MTIYYDTGVLLKLYTEEPKSAAVRAFVTGTGEAITFLSLHQSECASALHLKAFRNECSIQQANRALGDIDEDQRRGVLQLILPDWEAAWEKTFELTQAYATVTGCRTLDALHVALALNTGFRNFATSDKRQKNLADHAGLRVVDPSNPKLGGGV